VAGIAGNRKAPVAIGRDLRGEPLVDFSWRNAAGNVSDRTSRRHCRGGLPARHRPKNACKWRVRVRMGFGGAEPVIAQR
jgi:hypothetical protein